MRPSFADPTPSDCVSVRLKPDPTYHGSGGDECQDANRTPASVNDLQRRGEQGGGVWRQPIQIAEAGQPELAGAVHDGVVGERRIETAGLAGIGADGFDA